MIKPPIMKIVYDFFLNDLIHKQCDGIFMA
jgi:hypothetical protein